MFLQTRRVKDVRWRGRCLVGNWVETRVCDERGDSSSKRDIKMGAHRTTVSMGASAVVDVCVDGVEQGERLALLLVERLLDGCYR